MTQSRGGPLGGRLFRSMIALLAIVLTFHLNRPEAHGDDNRALPVAVTAIIENAQRLRSGQYRAHGHLKMVSWTEGPKYEKLDVRDVRAEEFIEADFDFDAGLNSFRRKRVDSGKEAGWDAELYRWFVQAADKTVVLVGNGHLRTVIIRPPTPWTEIWPNECSGQQPRPIFDPRSLGWGGYYSLCDSFDQFMKIWFLNTKCEIREIDEEGGLHRIESGIKISDRHTTALTIWCDEKQGWQPVRSSVHSLFSSPTQTGEESLRGPNKTVVLRSGS